VRGVEGYNLPEFLRNGMFTTVCTEEGKIQRLLTYAVESVTLKKVGESQFKPIKPEDLFSDGIIDPEELKKAFPRWEGCYCGSHPNTCGTKNYQGFSQRYDGHCQVKKYECPPNGQPHKIQHHFSFLSAELVVIFTLEKEETCPNSGNTKNANS